MPHPAAYGPYIEELELPVRLYNFLKRLGVDTVAQLRAFTDAELWTWNEAHPDHVMRVQERDVLDLRDARGRARDY